MPFRCLKNELLCREIFEVHNNDDQNTSDVTTMIEVRSETRSVVDDTDDVTQDILLDSNTTNSRSGSSFQESEAETIPDLSQIEVSVMKGKTRNELGRLRLAELF